MRIDYRPSHQWGELCDELTRELNFSNGFVQIHQGVQHGLMEVGLGLARLFPHKKKIHYFKNLNPHFVKLMMVLATKGYEVKELTLEEMTSPQDWVAQIDRKDLFVLYSVDDPILGCLYPVGELERLTHGRGIFRICVSHNWHNYTEVPKRQDDYKIDLYSMDFGYCISHLGERAHVEELMSGSLNWDGFTNKTTFEFGSLKESRDLIVEFESASSGMAPLSEKKRVFDRAVLCWEDLDGLALIDQIARDMGLFLRPPGEDKNFETTSLSRWSFEKSMESMEWLKVVGISPNQARGLVIFSDKIIDDQFVNTVQLARTTVLNRQLGKNHS